MYPLYYHAMGTTLPFTKKNEPLDYIFLRNIKFFKFWSFNKVHLDLHFSSHMLMASYKSWMHCYISLQFHLSRPLIRVETLWIDYVFFYASTSAVWTMYWTSPIVFYSQTQWAHLELQTMNKKPNNFNLSFSLLYALFS